MYIDEFDTFNAPKRALLAAMLPVADVTVCLCCDGEQDRDGGMGLFSGAKNVVNTPSSGWLQRPVCPPIPNC